MDAPVPPFHRRHDASRCRRQWDRDGQGTIISDDPLPCMVVAAMPRSSSASDERIPRLPRRRRRPARAAAVAACDARRAQARCTRSRTAASSRRRARRGRRSAADGRILACYGFAYQWPPSEPDRRPCARLGAARRADLGARTSRSRASPARRSPRARSTGSRRSSAPTSRPSAAGPSWSASSSSRAARVGPGGRDAPAVRADPRRPRTPTIDRRIASCGSKRWERSDAGAPFIALAAWPAARSSRASPASRPASATEGRQRERAHALREGNARRRGSATSRGSSSAGRSAPRRKRVRGRHRLGDRQPGRKPDQRRARRDGRDAPGAQPLRRLPAAGRSRPIREGKNALIGGLSAPPRASPAGCRTTPPRRGRRDPHQWPAPGADLPRLGRGSARGAAAASPGAFGAGIGARSSRPARARGELAARDAAEKQRQQESANAQAGVAAAQLSIDLTKDARRPRATTRRSTAPATSSASPKADARDRQIPRDDPRPKVRERWRGRRRDARQPDRDEDGWARGRRIEAIGTNVREAGGCGTTSCRQPRPAGVRAIAQSGRHDARAGVDAPADVKDKLGREGKRAARPITRRPDREGSGRGARGAAQSGALDLWLDPEGQAVLVDEARPSPDRRGRCARGQQAQAESAAARGRHRVQAADRSRRAAERRGNQALVGRAQALGLTDLVDDVGNTSSGKLKLSRETDKWTSAEWEHNVNALAAKVAGGKASAEEQQQLKILQELRPAKEARFRSDPDGFAAASGIAPPQVDLANPDAGASRRARAGRAPSRAPAAWSSRPTSTRTSCRSIAIAPPGAGRPARGRGRSSSRARGATRRRRSSARSAARPRATC
jgi:hypothetical protein